MRMISLRPHARRVSIASRVVPGMSDTIARSSPSSALSRLDLPTFGRPTIAIEAGRRLGLGGDRRVPACRLGLLEIVGLGAVVAVGAVALLGLADHERLEPSGRDLVGPRLGLGLARLARELSSASPAAAPRRSRRAGRRCRGRADAEIG